MIRATVALRATCLSATLLFSVACTGQPTLPGLDEPAPASGASILSAKSIATADAILTRVPAPTPTPTRDAASTSTPRQVGTPAPASGSQPAGTGLASPEFRARTESSVASLRGLQPKNAVPVRVVSTSQMREHIAKIVEVDYTEDERAADQALAQLLGFIEPDQNYLDLTLDLLGDQVVGLYDQYEHVMLVVGDRPQFGVGEQITYAHEFVHALQDQHYDLMKMMPGTEPNNDRLKAISALIEGDATLHQSLWAQRNFSARDILGVGQSGNTAAPQAAPYLIQMELNFPYESGLPFAAEAYRRAGGSAGINGVYKRLPASTEQIFHPEKYYANEAPIPVNLPDIAARLGSGWRQVGSSTLGELYLRVLVAQHTDVQTGQKAAAGWGGDRWQVIQREGEQAVLVKTVWDSVAEAREFFDAYTDALDFRLAGADVDANTPTRQAFSLEDGASDVRINGAEVTIILGPDRATADAIFAAL